MTLAQHEDRTFEAFVLGRGAALLRTCFLLTGNRADAEDLLQTALMRCLKHWDRLASSGAEESYVRTAIVRTHISQYRRRRLVELPMSLLPDRPGNDPIPPVDDKQALRQMLAQLPSRTRSAVVLRHYLNLSEAETAEVLECSVGSVKALTSRGLQRLRTPQAPKAQAVREEKETRPWT